MYNHDPRTKNLSPHTHELITCMVTGHQKKRIDKRYLKSLGYTKDRYLTEFPNAPLMANASREKYRKYAKSDQGKMIRSATLSKLNNDVTFQEARNNGIARFLASEESTAFRDRLSQKAKKQHENGLASHIRKYFNERFEGSEDQKSRSLRMKENPLMSDPKIVKKAKETYIRNRNNPSFHRNTYKNTSLFFQSTYEKDFLDYCLACNIPIDDIDNGKIFNNGVFYESDFMLFGEYVVEIKSWYIETLQERNKPNSLNEKKNTVLEAGYKWLYILDKDYSELDAIIKRHQSSFL